MDWEPHGRYGRMLRTEPRTLLEVWSAWKADHPGGKNISKFACWVEEVTGQLLTDLTTEQDYTVFCEEVGENTMEGLCSLP